MGERLTALGAQALRERGITEAQPGDSLEQHQEQMAAFGITIAEGPLAVNTEPVPSPQIAAVPDPPNDWDEWVMPIDEGILANLPAQGSRLGYHVLGGTVKTIGVAINSDLPKEARMPTPVIAQRIVRWLRPKGMVVEVKVHGSGGAKGYQITDRGQQMLAAMRKEQT